MTLLTPASQRRARLAVRVVCSDVLGDGYLPPVPVGQKLLLVVKEFLVCFSGKFVVGALHDRIHGAGFLLDEENDEGQDFRGRKGK